jgi:hypothetical protein
MGRFGISFCTRPTDRYEKTAASWVDECKRIRNVFETNLKKITKNKERITKNE